MIAKTTAIILYILFIGEPNFQKDQPRRREAGLRVNPQGIEP